MTDQRYRTQVTTAKANLAGSIAFSLLFANEDGEIHHKYAVDPGKLPSRGDVRDQRLRLLGRHIERLAESLELDEEEAVSAALELARGEENGE